jgi:hypothetical protein
LCLLDTLKRVLIALFFRKKCNLASIRIPKFSGLTTLFPGYFTAVFQSIMYGAFTPAGGIFATLTSVTMLGQPPTADPKPAIEDELESNSECDVEKIVEKEWVLVDRGYEPRYLVRWKGWDREHDEWHSLDDLENAMELVNAFDNKYLRSREPPRRKA